MRLCSEEDLEPPCCSDLCLTLRVITAMCLCQECVCTSAWPMETPPSGPFEWKTNGQVMSLCFQMPPAAKQLSWGQGQKLPLAARFWGPGAYGHFPSTSSQSGAQAVLCLSRWVDVSVVKELKEESGRTGGLQVSLSAHLFSP